MAVRNKIKRVSLPGGLIGVLISNPRKVLDDAIDVENQAGWRAIQVEPHKTTNLLILLLQILVLVITFGLWTWGAGYLILLEKE